jgi:hypothetical protein
VGYNFRLLLVWLEALFRALMAIVLVRTIDVAEPRKRILHGRLFKGHPSPTSGAWRTESLH